MHEVLRGPDARRHGSHGHIDALAGSLWLPNPGPCEVFFPAVACGVRLRTQWLKPYIK